MAEMSAERIDQRRRRIDGQSCERRPNTTVREDTLAVTV